MTVCLTDCLIQYLSEWLIDWLIRYCLTIWLTEIPVICHLPSHDIAIIVGVGVWGNCWHRYPRHPTHSLTHPLTHWLQPLVMSYHIIIIGVGVWGNCWYRNTRHPTRQGNRHNTHPLTNYQHPNTINALTFPTLTSHHALTHLPTFSTSTYTHKRSVAYHHPRYLSIIFLLSLLSYPILGRQGARGFGSISSWLSYHIR